jgi:hypothetical protein
VLVWITGSGQDSEATAGTPTHEKCEIFLFFAFDFKRGEREDGFEGQGVWNSDRNWLSLDLAGEPGSLVG